MIINKNILRILMALMIAFFSSLAISPAAYADDTNSDKVTTEENDTKNCRFIDLQNKYMAGSTCWYCFVVGKMTSSYLYAAKLVIPTIQNMARLILRMGFFIWLSLYVLKQVSSISPITSGKFLQEILIMGFKVLFATLVINAGVPFINAYIMTPIIDTGIDIGNSIFNEISKDFNVVLGGV